MTTSRWSRRRFLQRAGQMTGACLLGGTAGPALAARSRAGSRSLDIEDPELEAILGELVRDLERKALYASAFAEHRGALRASAERGETGLDFDPETRGVVFQAFDGDSFREFATDRMDADSLRDAAARLRSALVQPTRGAVGPEPGDPRRQAIVTPFRLDPAAVAPAEWLAFCKEGVELVHDRNARIRMANCSATHRWRRTLFVNRTRSIRQTLHLVGTASFAFALEEGKPAAAFLQDRGEGGFERLMTRGRREDELAVLVDDLLRAERIPPGRYEVVTSPAISGLLAHESFGHGVEFDQFVKGRARAAHFLGRPVASEIVSIWDDPGQSGAGGSYRFDDEGWEARPTAIVEGGIFRRPITDLASSFLGGAERTANGRRESYANKAYARMSNTFFGSGSTPVAELIGTLERGIYLDGFQSGIEDPHGWGIQLTCNRGYEIVNGQRTGRVFSPIGVTGYVPEILSSITHVGNDFALVPGTCGKGHKEFVPVSTGGPHLRFTAQLG